MNARPAQPGPNWRERQIPPRHVLVWARVNGTWRPGRLITWFITPETRRGWQCQIEAEPDGDSRPWSGRYVYDPEVIRPRHSTKPPSPGGGETAT